MPESLPLELSEAADLDLVDIHAYTTSKFGRAQADDYLLGMEELFISLTFSPMQMMAELPPGVTVSWSPAEGLSCTHCINPIANPEESTMYYVEIIDIYGFSSIDSVNVFVFPTLYIPNAFTPDGDIYNHVFYA
jgi:hypothetical protein